MKIRFAFTTAMALISILLFSCEAEPVANYKIQVLCTAGTQTEASFWGTYTIDGKIKNMKTEKFGTNSYVFESEVSAEDIIEISATKDSATSDLQIKIYKDGDRVKEAYLDAYKTISDNYVYTLRLEYIVPTEDDSEE
ncbi:MAG: hypothetical protein PF637_07445 [Spirochaetes bacterium]|jgi:hypothetical protein|nr:hypothetical protein [Spirochaetota bacterium]